MRKRILLVLFLIFAIAFVLSGCSTGEGVLVKAEFPTSKVGGMTIVEWQRINPPPEVEGRCWAYFLKETIDTHQGYGYSGVYCESSSSQ